MIADELRQAIRALKEQGRPLREISRALKVSRNTVRRVLRERQRPKGDSGRSAHTGHRGAVAGPLPRLQGQCGAYPARSSKTKHGIDIPYSTLTRLIREHTDLRTPKKRSGTYRFGPGEEMQHDTSPHRVTLGGKAVKSPVCQLDTGLQSDAVRPVLPPLHPLRGQGLSEPRRCSFFDGACPRCVIDNTSVILAGGSGANALIAPETEAFGELFGFEFMAHAIGHSDRKGRIERPFSYIENNFLAGRTFADWVDLNAQARAWCREVANAKPKRVLGMSPQAAYAMEKAHLLALPAYIPPVTEIHYRVVDCYGFVHLDTNRYSVPERLVGKKVAVHKRLEQVLVFCAQQQVAAHPRLIGQRQGEQRAKGHHTRLERRRAVGPSPQEQALSGRDPRLDRYVVALKRRAPGRGVQGSCAASWSSSAPIPPSHSWPQSSRPCSMAYSI